MRNLSTVLWPGVTVLALGAAGWFWWDGRQLAGELSRSRSELARAQAAPAPAAPIQSDAPAGASGTQVLFGMLGKAIDRASERHEREAAPGEAPRRDESTWQERRQRRMDLLRATFGRQPGESEAAYRERVGPIVNGALASGRERMSEARRQFEEAAGVTAEQRAALDKAFAESQSELVGLASQAVAAGQLTPYRRNTQGVLQFVGSTVGTMDTLDQRVRGVLTPEQLQVMQESGFDLLEYVGVQAPWDQVTPPPESPPGG